jgi:hypothetical protein
MRLAHLTAITRTIRRRCWNPGPPAGACGRTSSSESLPSFRSSTPGAGTPHCWHSGSTCTRYSTNDALGSSCRDRDDHLQSLRICSCGRAPVRPAAVGRYPVVGSCRSTSTSAVQCPELLLGCLHCTHTGSAVLLPTASQRTAPRATCSKDSPAHCTSSNAHRTVQCSTSRRVPTGTQTSLSIMRSA